jgi:hypothetical protein
MTFPENAQLTVVSAVAGVTAITIVVITAIVGVREVTHVSADVVQPVVVDVLYLLFASTESLRLLVSFMLLASLLFLL